MKLSCQILILTQQTANMATTTAKPQKASGYLFIYNTLFALVRIALFIRTTYLWTQQGNGAVWDELNVTARWTETFTVMEILHAVAGLVRAAPATTALQVAGRNTIIWAITRNYPQVGFREDAYSFMLMAWNAADAVRYLYFTLQTGTGSVPAFLTWLRYMKAYANKKKSETDKCADTTCL
jgi:very-long-chain (3R)-3-hydroxyacyl-CoA dehydratase